MSIGFDSDQVESAGSFPLELYMGKKSHHVGTRIQLIIIIDEIVKSIDLV